MAWSTAAQIMTDLIKALKVQSVSHPKRVCIYATLILSFNENGLDDDGNRLATCVGLDEAFDASYAAFLEAAEPKARDGTLLGGGD